MSKQEITTAEAGLSQRKLLNIVLNKIRLCGGSATMQDLYSAVEEHLQGNELSEQGRATLRENINRKFVREGYIQKFDRHNPGWRATGKYYM